LLLLLERSLPHHGHGGLTAQFGVPPFLATHQVVAQGWNYDSSAEVAGKSLLHKVGSPAARVGSFGVFCIAAANARPCCPQFDPSQGVEAMQEHGKEDHSDSPWVSRARSLSTAILEGIAAGISSHLGSPGHRIPTLNGCGDSASLAGARPGSPEVDLPPLDDAELESIPPPPAFRSDGETCVNDPEQVLVLALCGPTHLLAPPRGSLRGACL
jgi:hypothetical protein